MIPEGRRVSGETECLPDPEGGHAKDVRLDSQTVPVPKGDLDNGVDPDGLEMDSHGEGTHSHDSGLVVRDVEAMNPALKGHESLKQGGDKGPLWRGAFPCDHE